MIDCEKTLRAQWCVDSETSEQVLLDLETGKVIARKNAKGEIIYAE